MSELNQDKIQTITRAFSVMRNIDSPIKSFADLGGVWDVDGGYTFNTLQKHPELEQAVLIDTHFTPAVLEQAKQHPDLQLLHGNFTAPAIVSQVDVDAIFLFDVLLHQVNPNWDEVLKMYAARTNCFIIFNPQWIKDTNVIRLVDLPENEYFKNVPHTKNHPSYIDLYKTFDDIHPEHNKIRKDVHHVWQWGISNAALITVMQSLNFRMVYLANYKGWHTLPNFQNHAFIFVKQSE